MDKSLESLIIIDLVKSKVKSFADLDNFKRKISKKFKIPVISNIQLLKSYHAFCARRREKPDKNLELALRKRAMRSLSGVAVVSVLTKPYPCPGNCLYCPTEKGMPKSYLSNEPAVMRAILNKFDPYRQVQARIESLEIQGHPTDKVELIIIGGTWSYLPKKYQEWFVTRCFAACNNKSRNKIQNLSREQKKNEVAKHRIIGITAETRPDYINEKEILHLRKLGVTRVEMGVQSIYDDVLKFNQRGHSVKDTINATKLLKDAGFKICYHMMPNLPKSDLKRDEAMFRELFENQGFQPDLLKIYPCAVLKEAPLYRLWQKGGYKPYTEKQLTDLLLKVKKQIPYYCRIQRLTRDIPSQSIVEGPAKISNLRQILAEISKKQSWRCHCIRCREIKGDYQTKEKLYLFREEYSASGGREIFLSYESKNRERLYSLLRLRIPSEDATLSVIKGSSIIRELHTYGQLHPLLETESELSPQHKGLGKKLIIEAEKITKNETKLKKITVISGVGVRGYYKKFGYKLKDTYMLKKIR
ncbi:MAG: tRNA uridine(34) 5-carboxymethylaminomethyl modification radical SAM/GNAT enzyme Elp3 [Candidatus Staskawiczbacteria bacterium]|jgi:elongator complex protein 3